MSGQSVGIAGLVVAVASLTFAAWVYYRQRRPKNLDYRVLRAAPVASADLVRSGRIAVRHGDRSLIDPHTLAVRVGNNGKVPIRADDFEGNLTVHLGGADIREAWVVAAAPSGLSVELGELYDARGRPAHEFTLTPGLMNPGDWFEVEALVEGKPAVMLDGRVAGVEAIRDIDCVTTPGKWLGEWGAPLIVAGALGLLVVQSTADALRGNYETALAAAAVLGSLALAIGLLALLGRLTRKGRSRKPF